MPQIKTSLPKLIGKNDGTNPTLASVWGSGFQEVTKRFDERFLLSLLINIWPEGRSKIQHMFNLMLCAFCYNKLPKVAIILCNDGV